jgi:hypothetical protein
MRISSGLRVPLCLGLCVLCGACLGAAALHPTEDAEAGADAAPAAEAGSTRLPPVPDGRMDAPPPDAPSPDASPPDASPPDAGDAEPDASVDDSVFGDGGSLTEATRGYAHAIATDGTAIYVAGTMPPPPSVGGSWTIEKRSAADGSLVGAFADATTPPSASGNVSALAVDPTYLYAAGIGAIEKRELATGALVPGFADAFGSPGRVYDGIGRYWSVSLALDSGSLYVGGAVQSAPISDFMGGFYTVSEWCIQKRSAGDGAPVASFGANGAVAVLATAKSDSDVRTLLVADGWLYVAGFANIDGNHGDWRLEKRNLTTGALDTTFGSGGVIAEPLSTGDDWPVALASDGTFLYIAGFDSFPGNTEWRIEKRALGDGSLVTDFGASGVLVENPTAGSDEPTSLVVASGNLYVIGWDSTLGSDLEWRVEKRSATTGALVPAFANAGVFTRNPTTTDDVPWAGLTLGAHLFAAGGDWFYPGSGTPGQWHVERLAE